MVAHADHRRILAATATAVALVVATVIAPVVAALVAPGRHDLGNLDHRGLDHRDGRGFFHDLGHRCRDHRLFDGRSFHRRPVRSRFVTPVAARAFALFATNWPLALAVAPVAPVAALAALRA